jgi:hypothetical protein
MRLVRSRRLYHCPNCGQMMFIRPTEVLYRRAEETAARAGGRTPATAI